MTTTMFSVFSLHLDVPPATQRLHPRTCPQTCRTRSDLPIPTLHDFVPAPLSPSPDPRTVRNPADFKIAFLCGR